MHLEGWPAKHSLSRRLPKTQATLGELAAGRLWTLVLHALHTSAAIQIMQTKNKEAVQRTAFCETQHQQDQGH